MPHSLHKGDVNGYIAYYAKLAIHPTPPATLADLWERAAINYTPQPVPKTLATDNHQRVRI